MVSHVLDRLDLADFADRELGTLSGGEQQRLVIARALAQEAPILLLDEPTSALDIGHQQQALELVDRLRREHGLTVISAMHDLTLAGLYADRLALLHEGHVVVTGTAAARAARRDPRRVLRRQRRGPPRARRHRRRGSASTNRVSGEQRRLAPAADSDEQFAERSDHRQVVVVRQQLRRFGERGPAHAIDLAVGLEPPGDALHRPVPHPLVAAVAIAVEGLRQLGTEVAPDTGLFAHLPHGGAPRGLAVFELALGQRPVVVAGSMDQQDLDVVGSR